METIMPTKTTPPTTPMGVDPAAYEDAAKRIRDLTERLIESSKAAGLTSLDAYEKALQSIADYQEQVAQQTDVEWVSTIVDAQARFTRELTKLYVSTSRELLK